MFHAAGVLVGNRFGYAELDQETLEQNMAVQDYGGNTFTFFGEFHAAVRFLRHESQLFKFDDRLRYGRHLDGKRRRDILHAGDTVSEAQDMHHFQVIFETLAQFRMFHSRPPRAFIRVD